MATLMLQAAGSVVGGFLGGPVGAILGRAVGAIAGAAVDGALFNHTVKKVVQGPRLSTLQGLTSTEGAAIPRVWGRARVGGQLIWATRFEETATTTTTHQRQSGGKGGGGTTTTTTTYAYSANVAIGLCEGPIAFVRRVWADGKELDLTAFTHRIYKGDEAQTADPLIVAKEGAGDAPAYCGLAYVVFERMPLADFGNRVPQLSFEVVRPVSGLATMVRAVDLIPGAGEFVYATTGLSENLGGGQTRSENRHQFTAPSDWTASLDALQALCPNLESVALVVAWFGDDLRCGSCTIAPRVDTPVRQVNGATWSVAGLTRAAARPVSTLDGVAAYGGTPSDNTVRAAITDLKARGLQVVFYPFVMMDVPPGNGRPDPWSGAADQPAFPWRGRVTCDPAPGRSGSPDGTAAAATQVAAFFGADSPGAWSFRRFVLHYASLCVAAGGVDAFLIGSELAALTRVRSASGVYPAAAALVTLATDVRAVLGSGSKISYAADWAEYGADVRDAGAEVRFPLDVVWGSSAVDFVGLDVYWPLSDWRDGDHLDLAEAASVYDRAYLGRRVAAGEAFDWFYADADDRAAQVRTPISDGAYGKPWVFRAKDLVGWWSNAHHERVAGSELPTSTPWVPGSKPIWFVETGCPAVDRGANAPNVFLDPKSSESGVPFFSRGFRDDLMQARALEAVLTHFDPAADDFDPAANPVATLYSGRMVDAARIHLWTWDARPFPAFPMQASVWADSGNWETGHWLNGRLEGVPLDNLVQELVAEIPGLSIERPSLNGFVDGYVLDQVMSPRGALEPLATLFGFDGAVTGGTIQFRDRTTAPSLTLDIDDLVPDKNGKLVDLTRGQDSELPHEIALTFTGAEWDYQPATALSRRLQGRSQRESRAEVAVVATRPVMQRLTDIWLQDQWIARETVQFSLPPSRIACEIGDAVTLSIGGVPRLFRITRITDAGARMIEARAVEPAIYDHAPPRIGVSAAPAFRTVGPPRVVVLDLAIARTDPTPLQFIGAFADPWPGPLAVYRAIGEDTFAFVKVLNQPALIGETLQPFGPGSVARLDRVTTLDVAFVGGTPVSVTDTQMFDGANAAAVQGADGTWEMFAFASAELVAPGVVRLSRLLRGLGGAEALASRTVATGAPVVMLDAVQSLTGDLADLNVARTYRVGPANRDYADAAYVEVVATATTAALKPYALVRLRAQRTADGVAITFIRRGRKDSDPWEPIEIPLGEDREAYEVDIFRDGTVVLTIATTTPAALYPSAEELADFGSTQTSLEVGAVQVSATVGRGFPARRVIPIV